MPWRGGKVPDAILAAGVRVRIVGAADLAVRGRDFVLAATLLAVVFVLVQSKTVVARALVRPWRVLALVLTAAVVVRALVHICGKITKTLGMRKKNVANPRKTAGSNLTTFSFSLTFLFFCFKRLARVVTRTR